MFDIVTNQDSSDPNYLPVLLIHFQYAPFKKGGKGTLAERARAHGLEAPAQELVANPARVINLEKFVNSAVQGEMDILLEFSNFKLMFNLLPISRFCELLAMIAML